MVVNRRRAAVVACVLGLASALTAAAAETAAPADPADPIAAARAAVAKAAADKAPLQRKLADLLVKAGRKAEALEVYTDLALAGADRERRHAQHELFDFCLSADDLPAAAVMAQCVRLAQGADAGEAQRVAAQASRVARKRNAAADFCVAAEKAVAQNPHDLPANVFLASLCYSLGDYRRAAAAYAAAAGLTDDNLWLLKQLAYSNEQAGEAAAAAAVYERILAVPEGRNASLYYKAAMVNAHAGHPDRARAYVDAYLKSSGGGGPANEASQRLAASNVYKEMGDIDAAVRELREAIRLTSDEKYVRSQQNYRYYLIRLLFESRRPDAGEAECKKFLDDQGEPRLRRAVERQLERYLLARGAAAAAADLNAEIEKMKPAPREHRMGLVWRYEMAASLYEEAGDDRAALAAWEGLATLAPGSTRATRCANELRLKLRKAEADIAALLSLPDILWSRPDPFDKSAVWLAFPKRLVLLDRRTADRSEMPDFFDGRPWTPLCIAFEPECVWIGADRGAVVFDRAGAYWRRCAVNGAYDEMRIEKIDVGDKGVVTFSIVRDGAAATYRYDPAADAWHRK